MELRQLRYFVAVVESGSLSRASTILHVVQSALSQQMMQLEDELGTALLMRSVRGVQPTDAGSVFYRHAQAILKQLDNARASVTGTQDAVKGPVSVGIPASTGITLAPVLLARLRELHPDVHLSLVEAPSGQLAQMLASGGLDFSVLYHSNFLHGFDIEPLYAEPLCLLAPAGMPVPARRGAVRGTRLQDLVRMPLVLPRRPNATRLLLEAACQRLGLRMQVVAEADSLHTLGACVQAGVGATVLSAANIDHLALGGDRAQGPLTILPRIERQVVLARSRDFPRTQAAEVTHALARQISLQLLADGRLPGARRDGASQPAAAA